MNLDFVDIETKPGPGKVTYIYPEFNGWSNNDLMIKGSAFYAFWDSENDIWCTDEFRMRKIIDEAIQEKADESIITLRPKLFKQYSSGVITQWKKYCKEVGDNYTPLDTNIVFQNSKVKKTDYASKRLPYPLVEGDFKAYEELMNVLYDKKERRKIEWAIGSILAGDSKDIQKFYVFYGTAGSGKSTVLHIIEQLLSGYWISCRTKNIGNPQDQFSLSFLKNNPLVVIDHEGDLSRIEDNTKFNSIVSHDSTVVNEKFKSDYSVIPITTFFIGTNNPVRITDAKSGLLRRLIDISPSGRLVDADRYETLMSQIPFELSGIAYHCLQVYLKYGKKYYDRYKPTKMLDETNDMYNFVSDMLWEWDDLEELSLANAWSAYKAWCEDCNIPYPLMKRKFKTELKGYFETFEERGKTGRNVYIGLLKDKFKIQGARKEAKARNWITMIEQDSLLDSELADCKAQYATKEEIPRAKWQNVTTRLKDINTGELHYVKVPKNHIVIDFDIKNADGEKDELLNIEAAIKFPQTYAEMSKGGKGIHLHYIYEGDVEKLSRIYDDDIEVKVFTGNSSLRRKLTRCNDIPIATINSGLPLKISKGDNNMIDAKAVENERHLRALIKKSLNKEIHGHTKPEVDFINKILSDAYNEGITYDIRDMRSTILSFAMTSTNQSQIAYDIASKMKYCSKDHEIEDGKRNVPGTADWNEAPIVFFDVEVFPNLFIICWKKIGEDEKVVRMINPKPEEVKQLFKYRLVGFNNRRYDNHIIYARSQGYTNEELFRLSQKIIGKRENCFFGEAYGLSYTDILDYCSNANKMGLKKWEIKLGIFHLENQYPWDEPIDESHWEEIADYCTNDVIATEAVWNATQADFRGRQILAELSGLTVNDTSNAHTQQIIFGNDRHPQSQFNCPDLSKEFPGYVFENGVSTYMGEKVGEGGWVFYNPGMYGRVVCCDVNNMHGESVNQMNLFGRYTPRYQGLRDVRSYIKHKEYAKVANMYEGKLEKYLGSDEEAKELSNALKTPINSVYGLTAAHFPNRCRDPRNKDNVVAKRGALFMITLKNEVEKKGYTVVHCKTDSIKVADPDDDILKFIDDFGKKYGYTFEIEEEFERFCLVNKATFIAINKETGKWEAKAAQFAHPYVFKSLFTHEDIEFKDLCETKEVKIGSMYLDFNENLDDVSAEEKELKKLYSKWKKEQKSTEEERKRADELSEIIKASHNYHFVGKVGLFTPVIEGAGGGVLLSSADEFKYDAVTGTKGYRFLESDVIRNNGLEDSINMEYFDHLADEAIKNISKYGDFDIFVNANHEEYESYIKLKDSGYEREEI